MAHARDVYSRYYRADKITLIGENENRKLYRAHLKEPGGEPIELYAGESYATVEGKLLLLPEEPAFWSEQAGREWLASGKE